MFEYGPRIEQRRFEVEDGCWRETKNPGITDCFRFFMAAKKEKPKMLCNGKHIATRHTHTHRFLTRHWHLLNDGSP